MILPASPEEVLLRGLAQEPRRLAELSGFIPGWFTDEAVRLGFEAAVAHHQRAAEAGALRYATRAAIERGGRELAAFRHRDDRKVDALRRALAAVLDAEEPVDDHQFREAADAVRESAMDEVAREGLIKLVDQFRQPGKGAAGIAAGLRDLSGRIAAGSPRGSLVGSLKEEAAQTVRDYVEAKKNPGAGYIATPFPRLNELTSGGGRKGRMWLPAAYTKDGKTMVGKDLIYGAVTQGLGALVVTAEQTKGDVRTLLHARHTHKFIPGGIDLRRLATGKLTKAEERALVAATRDIAAGALGPVSYFQAPGGTTIADVAALAEATARKHPVDALMVDHSLLFHTERRTDSDVSRVSEVIREVKQLSLDANGGKGLWAILCHQISREGKDAADKRGGFHLARDLAGSSEAERSADLVLWLWRDERLKDVSEIRMGVAIDRHGPGDVRGWQCYERFMSGAILPIEEGP